MIYNAIEKLQGYLYRIFKTKDINLSIGLLECCRIAAQTGDITFPCTDQTNPFYDISTTAVIDMLEAADLVRRAGDTGYDQYRLLPSKQLMQILIAYYTNPKPPEVSAWYCLGCPKVKSGLVRADQGAHAPKRAPKIPPKCPQKGAR